MIKPKHRRLRVHRDAAPIPMTKAARKARVLWLMSHRLWTYDVPGIGREAGGGFAECVDIDPVYVCPATSRREPDEQRNTEFDIWIEAGGWVDQNPPGEPEPTEPWMVHARYQRTHDVGLDCGADDLETALLELAQRVEFFYGDRGRRPRRSVPKACIPEYRSSCVAARDGYCKKCGYAIFCD